MILGHVPGTLKFQAWAHCSMNDKIALRHRTKRGYGPWINITGPSLDSEIRFWMFFFLLYLLFVLKLDNFSLIKSDH